ncbi:MAG: TetR/AcrR family transcriptional regulator [Solirubrobacteraceae bacterium]
MSGIDQEVLRADARENRQRILRVAHDLLAVSNDASLNSIAKAAGVGAGTLYRHFPTREDLVLAVYRNDVQLLVDSVPELLEEYPPLEAFRHWFERLASYVRIKHGLGDALGPAVREDVVRDTYEPVLAAIDVLLRAGVQAGAIRPSLDPDDVLLIMGALWRVPPGEAGEAQAQRLLDLAIDGIRSR